MTKEAKPFPLENTLRDLALLRACEIDVSGLLPKGKERKMGTIDESVSKSYEFVGEGRKVMKAEKRVVGNEVDGIRNEVEEMLKGCVGHI